MNKVYTALLASLLPLSALQACSSDDTSSPATSAMDASTSGSTPDAAGTEPDTGAHSDGAAPLADGSTSDAADAQVSSNDSGADAASDASDAAPDADAAPVCIPSGVGMSDPEPCDPRVVPSNVTCCTGTCNVGIESSACGCFPDSDGTTGSGFTCTSNAQCCSGMCGPNGICGCIPKGTFADDPTLCCSGDATPGGLCD